MLKVVFLELKRYISVLKFIKHEVNVLFLSSQFTLTY